MRKYLITLALLLPSLALAGWPVVGGGSGAGDGLDPANNLCDVDDAAAALVCIGAQEQGDILDDLNTLGAAGSANQCIYSDGAGSFAYASCTATGLAVMAAADAAAARTAIDAQQESEPLTGISALGSTPANRFLYTVGLDTWLDGIITSDGVAILGGSGAANLAFNPAVVTDWDGDADPGNTDDALNQLAERVDDNEIALSGLGALATGDDAGDVPYTCDVDANWTGGLCPGTSAASLDDLASRINTLEGATVDAADVTFTPTTVGDWTGDADPGNTDEALDDLAGRVETLEGASGGESLVVFHPSSAAAAATGRIDVDNTTGITGDRLIITGPTGTVLRIGWENSAAPFPGDADVLLVSLPSSVNTNAGYIMRAINQTADAKIVWGPGGEIDVGITASQASPFSQDFVLLEADSNSDNNTPITSTHGGFTLQGMSGGSAGLNTYSVAAGVTAVVVDTTLSNTGTVTLPAAEDGRAVTVSTLPGLPGGVTVDGDGAELVDGQATTSVRGYGGGFKFISDGTEWYSVLSRGKRGAWDWTQDVEAPSAADWTDASSAGADVSLSTLADCTVGDCVRMVPGASTTDRYGATMSIGAGDFVWCGLLGVVTSGTTSLGTVQSGRVGFVFVDGTDVDTDKHYGIHSSAISDDFDARIVHVQESNGGSTDEWDAAWAPDVTSAYPSFRLEACFERSGTDLTTYFSPHGSGWVKADSYTVSAGAGLMAVVIDEDDAVTDEAVIYGYGNLGGLPWE